MAAECVGEGGKLTSSRACSGGHLACLRFLSVGWMFLGWFCSAWSGESKLMTDVSTRAA
jgi:hypothetical protein